MYVILTTVIRDEIPGLQCIKTIGPFQSYNHAEKWLEENAKEGPKELDLYKRHYWSISYLEDQNKYFNKEISSG